MPFQAPSWTEFHTCPICENEFSTNQRLPISLGCGHTICRVCLATVYNRQCPFDQTYISTDVGNLPVNNALLQILNSGDSNGNGDEASNISNITYATTSNANSSSNNNNNNNNNTNINFNNINSRIKKPIIADSDDGAAAGDQEMPPSVRNLSPEDFKSYTFSKKCIEELAQYLKSFVTNSGSTLLTRPMLRKLVTLVNCQLVEQEGRIRAVRTSRFLGERTVIELLLQHQNPQQLSLCLWAAVRSRGCQFLGPSMQEEVLKLVLQALEKGHALSRKVLVMYVVQRLLDKFLPASKTSIGHVVQLLYRASCFKVSKRDGDSSLMQLKEEFRDYEALRREHDAQIVQIATEAGLRIAPDQWSSLLYGNTTHKSHMQSICDTLQTSSSFSQSIQELILALQRTGDPVNLYNLRPHLKYLASIDPSTEVSPPSWVDVEKALDAVRHVVLGLVKFIQFQSNRKVQDYAVPPFNSNGKYKISLCRDYTERRMCPRGTNCTFAHSAEERQRYRAKHRRTGVTVEKTITRPGISPKIGDIPGTSGSSQTLENKQNSNTQQNQLISTMHQQHHNQTSNHLHTSPVNMIKSPIKVKVKSSPIRKFANNEKNALHPNLLDASFVSDLSNTSPLHMQGSLNALHTSPIPPGHMVGIVNVPPLHQNPNYENIPFGSLNFVGATGVNGKFVRMPNITVPLSAAPHSLQPNLIGPISNSSNGEVQGPSSRSSAHNLINMTTVVNPPNLQGTNSNKPPSSPQHYNNSSDYYNTVSTFFGNPNPEMQLAKTHIPPNLHALWESQQQHSYCQPLLKPADYPPSNISQHQRLFLQPSSNKSLEANAAFFDKSSLEFNKIQSFDDAAFQLNANIIFRAMPSNFLEPSRNHAQKNRNQNDKDSFEQEKQNSFWHEHLPSNTNIQNSVTLVNNHSSVPIRINKSNRNNSAVDIEPVSASSLFRDRESFVRSDSILDDDAATFVVTPTSTAVLGNKYGPICPMYKGLNTSTSPNSATNSFVGSWNALISQENDKSFNNSSNPEDLSMFSINNNNPLNMRFERQLSASTDLTAPTIDASSQKSAEFENFKSMEAALSKLSLNFCDESRSDQHFDYDPLQHILGINSYEADMAKNNELLWNISDINDNNTNSKQSTMNLGMNSFWSDTTNDTTTASTTMQPSTSAPAGNNPQFSQLQKKHLSHKLDDTELDITEIVDQILPYADDSGIKLD